MRKNKKSCGEYTVDTSSIAVGGGNSHGRSWLRPACKKEKGHIRKSPSCVESRLNCRLNDKKNLFRVVLSRVSKDRSVNNLTCPQRQCVLVTLSAVDSGSLHQVKRWWLTVVSIVCFTDAFWCQHIEYISLCHRGHFYMKNILLVTKTDQLG